jgi:hypothetical protein
VEQIVLSLYTIFSLDNQLIDTTIHLQSFVLLVKGMREHKGSMSKYMETLEEL